MLVKALPRKGISFGGFPEESPTKGGNQTPGILSIPDIKGVSSHMELYKKLLQDILTTADGVSYDIGRVVYFLTFIFYNLFTGIELYITHVFEHANYAAGLSAITMASAVHLRIKKDTEPGATQQDTQGERA